MMKATYLSKLKKGSYAVLLACTMSHFIHHIYTGSLAPVIPLIKEELSLTYTEVGIVASSSVITLTISHLLVGYLGDKGIRGSFISLTVILSAIALLITSLSNSFIFLTVCMLLLGITASGYHPAAFPELSKWFSSKQRAISSGVQDAGGIIAMAIIPLLGITLSELVGGWRESFVIFGVLGIFIFVPTYFLMRFSKGESSQYEENQTTKDDIDGWTKNFSISIVSMGLRGMTFRCITLLMPFYLVEKYGIEPVWAGSLTTVMLSVGLLGVFLSMNLSDRMQKRLPFMIISNGLMTPCLFFLNLGLSEIMLILNLSLIGFFFFLGAPANTAWISEISPKKSQGLAFGLLFSVGAMPGALAPFIFGAIGDLYGLDASILFLVTTALLSTVLTLFLREPKIKEEKPTAILL
jgi:MFS family permease